MCFLRISDFLQGFNFMTFFLFNTNNLQKQKHVYRRRGTPLLDVSVVQDEDIPDGRWECQTMSHKENIVANDYFLSFKGCTFGQAFFYHIHI